MSESPLQAHRLSPLRWMAAPETLTAALLAATFMMCATSIPRFMDAAYLLDRSSLYIEVGLMALAMTFVIVAGHIDLSCASILALVAAVVAWSHERHGVPFGLAVALALPLGALLGAVNGVLVAGLGLPSLVVTLATMAVYRGLAQVMLGDHSITMPDSFVGFERYTLTGTDIPLPLMMFLILGLALGLILHRTVPGRWISAMGTNPEASRYAGVPVRSVTVGIFILSGVLSALAGLTLASRLGVARYDNAMGMELDVITAVVLGGASIFGGRGTIIGTVLAITLIAVLQTGLGVANVKAEYQQTASGALLIFAVLLSNLTARLRK